MENNESKNNNKGLIILIIIFGLIVLGLGGWMVYDKVINKDEPNPVEENNSGEKQEANDKLLSDFPKNSDTSNIIVEDLFSLLTNSELKTNFKSIKKESKGNNFEYNCNSYDNKDKLCNEFTVNVNNELTLNYGWYGWSFSKDDIEFTYLKKSTLYKVENYYIELQEGYYGNGCNIFIYKDGKRVYYTSVDKDINNGNVFALNGKKLHLLEVNCDDYCKHEYELTYSIIDLSNSKILFEKTSNFSWGEVNKYFIDEYPDSSDIQSLGYVYDLLEPKEMRTNFKNLEKEKNGDIFTYNCNSFSKTYNICDSVTLKINGVKVYEDETDPGWIVPDGEEKTFYNSDKNILGLYDEVGGTQIYNINNYYITETFEHSASIAHYDIYDKNGKLVYHVEHTWGLSVNGFGIVPFVAFKDNKMHIVVGPIETEKDDNYKFEYNVIDLSKDKISIKKVKEFYVDNLWGDDEE